MTDNIIKPWIDIGYDIFSKLGPTGLKVEGIAKLANKNKSSFYHHFADMEYFTQCLLAHHLQRKNSTAVRAEKCACIVPDLLLLLVDIKQDLLFNRQLRINRHLPEFKMCFENANKPVENAFIKIWSEALGLQEKEDLAKIVLKLTVDNFYLQITDETLTYEWLLDYFNEIRKMVIGIKKISNS